MPEDEIVTVITVDETPVGSLDGAGSGYGISSCPSCGRMIDRTCSTCTVALESSPEMPEDARRRHEELREQSRRERSWYDRGAR